MTVIKTTRTGFLLGFLLFLSACTPEPGDANSPMNSAIEARSPAGVLWQVEDIDGGGIIDSAHITLQIDDDGISGSTGCNRYFGAVAIAGSAFVADAIGSTRMACAPALMQQEQRFVQALQAVRRFELSGDFLLLYDDSQVLRLRLIATDEPSPTIVPG